jgi:Zn-finger protein
MNCPDCIYPHKRGNYGALMNSLHQMYDRQHKNDPDYVDGSV